MTLSRREFLKGAAAGVAAVSAAPAITGQSVSLASDPLLPAAVRPKFHSRHIPVELLNLKTPTGKNVVRNGLCDTIKPDVLKRLRDFGVDLIEMRLVWWEFEPETGRFDWSRTLRDMDAVLDAGLKVGMFAWFQYPPTWYDPTHDSHARFRALGSNIESSVLSLWDPKTIEVYDRLMQLCAERLKGRISFVYNAISGTFGEIDYSLGANHYKFSSLVDGCLLGDRCARASFAAEMRQKYGSVDALNKAWNANARSFDDDLMPRIPFAKNPLRHRDDCMQWSTGSLLAFADRVCSLYKRHFPGIPGGLPMGFTQEVMHVGQIKSLGAKLAAKHHLTARWTGCAVLGEFGRSNVLARRIASAAHYYGAPFGTEAALTIDAQNAANGLYESLANGGSLVHDDPQNIFRAAEVHKALRPMLLVDTPETSVVVFYPVEDSMLELEGFSWEALIDRGAELRRFVDYDVCDSYMIADDYLKAKRDLIFLVSSHLRNDSAKAIIAFAAKRGRVWLFGDSKIEILYDSATFVEMAANHGIAESGVDHIGPTGVYRLSDWQQAVPHLTQYAFTIPGTGETCYRTLHRNHESCYFPKKERFEIHQRADKEC